jgi:predicted DNA-binding transcriptional regulator AlpA
MAKQKKTYTPQPLPIEGYVRLPTVLALFPISASSWWAGVKSGKYPQPVKLASRTTAWKAEDIRRLLGDEAA